jgi:hypothetical protein
MHSILALTLMHDRHLSGLRTSSSTTEAFHRHESVNLFNARLSGAVEPSERDALWATAMSLGMIAFFDLEAETADSAWPLTSTSPTDLSWLNIANGTWRVPEWKLTMMEKGSLFEAPFRNKMSSLFASLRRVADSGCQDLPPEFIRLYGLDTPSTKDGDTNQYRDVATSLARTLDIPSILPFLAFTGSVRPEFLDLLIQKDARALLLLAYWYAKISQLPQWWTSRHSVVEGQAICLYLERNCQNYDADFQRLLVWPTEVLNNISSV